MKNKSSAAVRCHSLTLAKSLSVSPATPKTLLARNSLKPALLSSVKPSLKPRFICQLKLCGLSKRKTGLILLPLKIFLKKNPPSAAQNLQSQSLNPTIIRREPFRIGIEKALLPLQMIHTRRREMNTCTVLATYLPLGNRTEPPLL